MDNDTDSDHEPCSYCGKLIYADSPRCPCCGNYTDGLGNFEKGRQPGQRLPRIWVIAGWLAVIGMLLPFLFMLYNRFNR
jgi:hypothetical protein